MRSSHTLDRWLTSREVALGAAGISARSGRGPLMAGQPSATWISFETAGATGRLVLWDTGRCQLDASSNDSTRRWATERDARSSVEVDDALTVLTGYLDGLPGR